MTLIGVLNDYSGLIKWYGKDLKTYQKEYFRSLVGYVGPETYIISGTIKDNLCYGFQNNPDMSLIYDACKKSNSINFIDSFNEKFNANLSEQGDGLSMGQKQRLGLARAFLRNPKILILDEFTSNLDKKNELLIMEEIKSIKKNMIIIIATHSEVFDSISDKIINLDMKDEV